MVGCGTPTTSRRATTRRRGGSAWRARPPVASSAAPAPPRGRGLRHCRRDASRASLWSAEQTRSELLTSARHRLTRRSRNSQVRAHGTAQRSTSEHPASALTRQRSPPFRGPLISADGDASRGALAAILHPRHYDEETRSVRERAKGGAATARQGSWDGLWDELQTLAGRRGP